MSLLLLLLIVLFDLVVVAGLVRWFDWPLWLALPVVVAVQAVSLAV